MTTEAKVGAFVLGCFAVLAFTVIYLLNAQYSGGTVHYRTYLRYAGGLEPGASVLYGGMNVGKVTAVRPWPADPTRIEILLEVKKNTPLNEKSVAKLGFVSVMNSAALSITTPLPTARWLTLETPHFELHFYPEEREFAEKAAHVAERAYRLITRYLNWEPQGRVSLLLTDQTDAANGGASSVPYNYIYAYGAPPDGMDELSDFDD
mgnify:CR=1 FL=1